VAQQQSEQTEQTKQQEGTEQQDGEQNGGGGNRGGLKTAAAASVAAGVSYLVATRALDQRGSGGAGDREGASQADERDVGEGGGKSPASRTTESLRSAVDVLTWDKAQSMLLPMAERAATAAGGYVAKEAPEFVSERLIPRFIEAFNKAKSNDSSS
jgi:hypothetical protein